MKQLTPKTAHAAWTGALLAGLPLFAWQAYRLRRDTPRLPVAPGPTEGVVPGAEPLIRLAVIGESTAAGVGAPDHVQGLAGCSATRLGERTGRSVQWLAAGHNGATARQTRYQYVPQIDRQTDVVVIALGVNDVLSGCGPDTWRNNLTKLLASTRRRAEHALVMLCAVPPMGHFPAIPQPLRGMLGLRASAFDRISSLVAAGCPSAVYLPMPFEGGEQYFCEDRFHPSTLGYRRWGELVGEAAALRLHG